MPVLKDKLQRQTAVNAYFSNKQLLFFLAVQGSYKCCFNLLSPHDALRHHFTSLKTDWIFLQPRLLKWKFPWNRFANTWNFFKFFKPHQVIFIHYKLRIATAIRGL